MENPKQISKQLKLNRSGMHVVMSQVKALQGTFSIYMHFKDELKTLKKQLSELSKSIKDAKMDCSLPKKVTMFSLADSYHKYISNPHPYPHHLLEIANNLGFNENTYLQINLFERFLHAVDKIDPHFYQNPLHKQEVKQVLMQTLEDLYEKVEEMEENAELEEDDDLLLEEE